MTVQFFQEEERMAAERKTAAEQKLRALEDRCAQREREMREREEREAREREERESRERSEREARERAEREARERVERERRQQQDEAAAMERQRRDNRASTFDSREKSRSPSVSPRGEWSRLRKGGPGPNRGESDESSGRARPHANGPDGFRRGDWERGPDVRNAWPANRRDGSAENAERKNSMGGGGFAQRDRMGDVAERGPRKLFDPKQNRLMLCFDLLSYSALMLGLNRCGSLMPVLFNLAQVCH